MKRSNKFALVAGGYLLAGLLAVLAVAVNEALTAADVQGSDGMAAFGDLLLFVAVFGVLALIPTAAAAYFFLTRKSKVS